MNTSLLICNRVISHICIFKAIISDRDTKFTYALWTNLNRLFGTKLSFYTSYDPKADGLAERMIQKLEYMIKWFFSYLLELKDSDGFTNDLFTLIPELKLGYKTPIQASMGEKTAIIEKAGIQKFQLRP
ncbi:hypothetical protein O181_005647 [Austropuccinia psidii MF-1]|uniref:Integrase catalytic domain-containing protein n=1 Tax=Austropuccinia psidii MF-1 TaxID=1389203 RepID=A0A9Q3BJ57_9BASI|nr:hypothetical protein [Austropuccinia psidii MF-1]